MIELLITTYIIGFILSFIFMSSEDIASRIIFFILSPFTVPLAIYVLFTE